jgi:hypothetical protein
MTIDPLQDLSELEQAITQLAVILLILSRFLQSIGHR